MGSYGAGLKGVFWAGPQLQGQQSGRSSLIGRLDGRLFLRVSSRSSGVAGSRAAGSEVAQLSSQVNGDIYLIKDRVRGRKT